MTDEAPAFRSARPATRSTTDLHYRSKGRSNAGRAKILAAPDDPTDWPLWRERLAAWREDLAPGYDGAT
jgi:hypothetical protein